ncbi:hypothetical protein A5675_17350 [Mycobacterium malmoense]|nr:hypothetical protein A5675_17350 [Mycobacterium malmoense]
MGRVGGENPRVTSQPGTRLDQCRSRFGHGIGVHVAVIVQEVSQGDASQCQQVRRLGQVLTSQPYQLAELQGLDAGASRCQFVAGGITLAPVSVSRLPEALGLSGALRAVFPLSSVISVITPGGIRSSVSVRLSSSNEGSCLLGHRTLPMFGTVSPSGGAGRV